MSAEKSSCFPTDPEPLHLIAFFGLTVLIPYYDPAELQFDLEDRNEPTPFDLAFEQRQKRMADWLLGQYQLSPTAAETEDMPPLVWLAARNNWADIISVLVKKGFDSDQFGRVRRQGWLTPLQEAIHCGSDSAVQSLIDVGADLNTRNSLGETALMMAINMKRLTIVDKLLDLRADVTIHSNNGNTALTNAIRHGLLDPVTRILERDEDVRETSVLRTSLQVAASSGAHNLIDVLLQYGAELECTDTSGLTPLLVAASNGHLDVVKKLLSSGAQLTSRSTNHATILHYILGAPVPKRGGLLQWVLEHGDEYVKTDQLTPVDNVEIEDGLPGVEVTTTMQLLDSPNEHGDLPLHLASSLGDMQATRMLLENPLRDQMIRKHGSDCLGRALAEGDFDCSEVLFDACRDILPQFPPPDESLMVYAAQSGNADLIPLVLRNGSSPAAEDEDGRTPLHIAAYWGHTNFIKSLTDQVPGLDYYHKDTNGRTPLHRAVYGGELEVTELLLPHYSLDKDLGDDEGNWPLHVAAEENEVKCVAALIKFDPKGVDRPNAKGETALHRAAQQDHHSIIKYLIALAGANVNAMDNEGLTILHRAVFHCKTDTALLIIGEGKFPATVTADKDGWTALHYAASTGNEVIVRHLLDCGCEPYPEEKYGRTPFFMAVDYQHHEIVDLYLSRGLNEDVKQNLPGKNCALAAARCGNLELWRKLVVMNETLADGVDVEGDNAVCVAAHCGHTHMLDDMLARGLDVNGRSEYGKRTLIMAASNGRVDTVRYLCQNGADLNCRDFHGRTALHWAVIWGFDECQSVLVEAGADQEIRDELGVFARDYNPNLHLLSSISSPEFSDNDPRSIHWPTTRNFVLQSVERLRQTNNRPSKQESEDSFWETWRETNLMALWQALYLLKDFEIGAIVNTGYALLIQRGRCTLCCCILKDDSSWYRCTLCWTKICERCLSRMHDEITIKQLQRMERDTVPARKILRPIAHYGHRMVLDVFNSHRALWDWVWKRADAYSNWEHNFVCKGWTFSQRRIPGWELVGILCTLDDEFRKTNGSVDDQHTSLNEGVEVDERLRDLFRDHSPDKEVSSANCEGHRYAEIKPMADLTEAEKAMFGPNNEFTELFFQTLEDKYRQTKHPSLLDPTNDHCNGNGLVHAVSNTGKQSAPIKQHPQPALETDEEDMHVAADRQIEFLLDPIQHDLVRQWRLIEPGKQGRSRAEQRLVLETAWQLAQAIAHHEVRRPSLADIDNTGPVRSYWRKGDESGDSDNESPPLSDLDSNWGSDL